SWSGSGSSRCRPAPPTVAATWSTTATTKPAPRRGRRCRKSADPIGGETSRRLPKPGFDDRKALRGREVEDELGDVFGRGVEIDEVERFAQLFQGRHRRVVAPQNHAVVEIFVDPAAHHSFDVGKIEHHAAPVELGGLDYNYGPPAVAMQMAAFSLVVEQAVAIAKIDLT